MTGVPIQQMADRVAGLMEEKLGIRGQGLADKLRKGGRHLPRKVRIAGDLLAQGAAMSQNPKLLLQVDQTAVANAYDICVRHLGGVKSKDRSGVFLGIAASIAMSVLMVVVLVLAVMKWRGFI